MLMGGILVLVIVIQVRQVIGQVINSATGQVIKSKNFSKKKIF